MFELGYAIAKHLWLELSALLVFLFVLNRAKVFRNTMQKYDTSLAGKLLLAVVFGAIGIFGTYRGIPVVDGIANTRAVGVIVGGLIGGPIVGAGAGLIAGIHRTYFPGFTAFTSAWITLLQGVCAGMLHESISHKKERWQYALGIAFAMEAVHMLMLIIFARPLDRAIGLVLAIAPAMLLTNSIGVAAFIGIWEDIYREKEKVEALAAKLALNIVNKTLTYLRNSFDEKSALETATIILNSVDNLSAVAITSRGQVLAFVGVGQDHHSDSIITDTTKTALNTGVYGVYQTKADIRCPVAGCPLAAKVVVPLRVNQEIIGALVLYKSTENSISLFEKELALGLANLISTQIEISKGERQAKLLAHSEIKALQAQINPHFLFNALNTIVYYCRKQPETARRLLIHLSNFYRNNLSKLNSFVSLEAEIQHVNAYIAIEIARFQGKLNIIYDIDPECECMLPPLILQPLVENAIKHGIHPRKEGGTIVIRGRVRENTVELSVVDDGLGMSPETLSRVLDNDPTRRSIGLCNVHSRLRTIYGPGYGLRIESSQNAGTKVEIIIPQGKENHNAVTGTDSG